jgi:hypothetical protein
MGRSIIIIVYILRELFIGSAGMWTLIIGLTYLGVGFII